MKTIIFALLLSTAGMFSFVGNAHAQTPLEKQWLDLYQKGTGPKVADLLGVTYQCVTLTSGQGSLLLKTWGTNQHLWEAGAELMLLTANELKGRSLGIRKVNQGAKGELVVVRVEQLTQAITPQLYCSVLTRGRP